MELLGELPVFLWNDLIKLASVFPGDRPAKPGEF
jgi:hypothetical protein